MYFSDTVHLLRKGRANSTNVCVSWSAWSGKGVGLSKSTLVVYPIHVIVAVSQWCSFAKPNVFHLSSSYTPVLKFTHGHQFVNLTSSERSCHISSSQPPDTTPSHPSLHPPPLHPPASPSSASSCEEEIESDEETKKGLVTRYMASVWSLCESWKGKLDSLFTLISLC